MILPQNKESTMLFNMTVSKIDESVDFDWTTLPESSQRYVVQYGLNKSINDCHASIKRSDYADGPDGDTEWRTDVRDAAFKRIEQIRSGNTPGTRQSADPKTAAMRKLVSGAVANVNLDAETMALVDPVKLAAWITKQVAAGRNV
jgi:hypothetical protein